MRIGIMSYETVYTEGYKGLTINIIPDSDCQNPFDDWDCEPPLAVYNDGRISEYAVQYGSVFSDLPSLSAYQIRKHLPAILAMTGCKDRKELVEAGSEYSDDSTERINYAIHQHIQYEYASNQLDIICELYNMAGIPALCKDVHGCSQGDWAKVLAVATPEFQEACGNGKNYWKDPQTLKGSIQLFEDWAYCNVYGYEVEDADGEVVRSCWGFFGDYDNEYGALSEARGEAESHANSLKLERIEQIKTWIRNRVPFQYRLTA